MFEIAGIVYCCNDSSGQHKSIVVRSCSACCPERSCIANYKVKQTTDYLVSRREVRVFKYGSIFMF